MTGSSFLLLIKVLANMFVWWIELRVIHTAKLAGADGRFYWLEFLASKTIPHFSF
jgi:hypothetical protein